MKGLFVAALLLLASAANAVEVAVAAEDASASVSGDVGAIAGVGMAPEAAKTFYDSWASEYTASVDEWGYDMPEQVAALLSIHVDIEHQSQGLRILDAGAGDGLSGGALRAAGFVPSVAHLTGIDLSPNLLAIAKQRGVYDELLELNLARPLPFPNDSFDIVLCVGTLTYLAPSSGVLDEFARVAVPGGLVSFNLRTDHESAWAATLEGLTAGDNARLELVNKTEPLPYLPNNPAYGGKVLSVVFVFRVR